jgi:hypothetical protein
MAEVICHKCEYYDCDEEEEWCNNNGELIGDTLGGSCTKTECDDFQELEGGLICQITGCEVCNRVIVIALGDRPICRSCLKHADQFIIQS